MKLLPILFVLTLTACTSGLDIKSIEGEVEKERTVVQALADKLLGEVEGIELRSLRMCMIGAGFSEVLVDRIKFDPEMASAALGSIAQIEGMIQKFRNADPIFLNTDIQLIVLQMTSTFVDSTKARVINGLLPNLTGGINVLGLAERAKIAARQASIASAVIRDIRALLPAVQRGEIDQETAMQACMDRINLNKLRIQ